MRELPLRGPHRTFSGFFREEEGDGNTQNTPGKHLQSENHRRDSQSFTDVMHGETESEGGSVLSEPPSLPGLEVFQAQVSAPHLESGVQISWRALAPSLGLTHRSVSTEILDKFDVAK